MPKFDPVKDAIENSPVAKTQPLPPTPTYRHDILAPSPPVEPPSPSPRSSSLSMLLNDAQPPPAKRQRTSSLAHLLSPTDARPGSSGSGSLQLDTEPSSARLPRRPSDPATAMPPPPLPQARPPSAPPPVPYAPRRISAPVRVNQPITPDEWAQLENSSRNRLRTGPPRPGSSSQAHTSESTASPLPRSQPAPSPGSRPGSSSGPRVEEAPNDRGNTRKRRRSDDEPERPRWAEGTRGHSNGSNGVGDSRLVAQHYNQRKEVGIHARRESAIIGLRNFNNWIKSVLIAKFGRRPLHESGTRGSGGKFGRMMSGKVLDLGCGKGGDLRKWSKANIREYVGLDIADVSISQARDRYMELPPSQRFDAEFHAFDCFSASISTVVSPQRLSTPFDVVSMQFCMHYAFESLPKVRIMLQNVSDYLRTGGIFLGTIPNSDLLLSKLNQLEADELSFGNSVYRVRFDTKREQPVYGHRYWFYLRDAVEDVPEFVVRWDEFKALALEYGLKAVYRSEFHDLFNDERRDSEFGPLLQKMKVVNSRGDSEMTEDQWHAANIYIAFAFEKI
ncbi:mRNA cap guanine-N7 methyltransferase [Ceratobasidium sp. AG-Ba]|nr:mRNA cap guanine-N7 methyltransferase [Ceratobasidium sp. AG-Ba]QRW14773.1 mRNA cap guanine-N7 methyltransferase [Ceratobasidium sp. AG-Ba]